MRLLKIFVLSTLISTFAFAQDNLPNNGYALSFGISQNFTLSDFDGFIAFKKIFNSGNQLRFLLRPQYTHKTNKYENRAPFDEEEIITSDLALYGGADYLWRLLQKNNVQMYGGCGFLLGYGYGKAEQTLIYNDTVFTPTQKVTSWKYELRGILGVEWSVSKNIGLHAEYILNFRYDTIENKLKSRNGTHQSENYDRFSLGQSVCFGISFYL